MAKKTGLFKIGIAVVVAGAAIFAVANDRRSARACKAINEICRAHGYQLGHTAELRQIFYKDCFLPLTRTGKAGSISVPEKIAQDCRRSYDPGK